MQQVALVVAFLVWGAAAEPPVPSGQYAPSPQYGGPGRPGEGYPAANGGYGDEAYNEEANYEFKYDVEEQETSLKFGHQEARQGDVATGRYYVLLPDGRTQLVEYTADQDGYRPKITYEDPRDQSYGGGAPGGQGGYSSGGGQGGKSGSNGYSSAGGAPNDPTEYSSGSGHGGNSGRNGYSSAGGAVNDQSGYSSGGGHGGDSGRNGYSSAGGAANDQSGYSSGGGHGGDSGRNGYSSAGGAPNDQSGYSSRGGGGYSGSSGPGGSGGYSR